MRLHAVLLALLLLLVATGAVAAKLEVRSKITFEGKLSESRNISGVCRHGDLLVICSDESSSLDLLKPVGIDRYTAMQPIDLATDEIDMEGVASDGKAVYVLGSHSLVRKKLRPEGDYAANRDRLAEVKKQSTRNQLFRLELDAHGELSDKKTINLHDLFKNDPLLRPFAKIPSKENGIDLEGIAVKDGQLYVGFRGPVLREKYVPVMVFSFAEPEHYELRFVCLGGRGIRDLAAVQNGFLVIGGPVTSGGDSFRLYHWDGKDSIPGTNSPGGTTIDMGTIPTPPDCSAEGLAVLAENEKDYELLIVYDGAPRDGATKFVVPKQVPSDSERHPLQCVSSKQD